jgi:hypothetical protein
MCGCYWIGVIAYQKTGSRGWVAMALNDTGEFDNHKERFDSFVLFNHLTYLVVSASRHRKVAYRY